jgi:hypothetical protein
MNIAISNDDDSEIEKNFFLKSITAYQAFSRGCS